MIPAPLCKILIAGIALSVSGLAEAQELSRAKDVMRTEILACAERALAQDLQAAVQLDWPSACQKTATDRCTFEILNDADSANDKGFIQTCQSIETSVWSEANQLLRTRLEQRWQQCALPAEVKSSMIAKIARLDYAFGEMKSAACDYDAGQWTAVGNPEMAAFKLSSCLAEMELARAMALYAFWLKDVGCETAPD